MFHLNVISSHQYFHCILQIAYRLVSFYTYSLYNLNIIQHSMIYYVRIHNCLGSLHSHLNLSLFHCCLLLETLASSLELHLQVFYHFMFDVSLVFGIRLNNLTFMFLTTSGTLNFEYGSLILMQLSLHLFILTL